MLSTISEGRQHQVSIISDQVTIGAYHQVYFGSVNSEILNYFIHCYWRYYSVLTCYSGTLGCVIRVAKGRLNSKSNLRSMNVTSKISVNDKLKTSGLQYQF